MNPDQFASQGPRGEDVNMREKIAKALAAQYWPRLFRADAEVARLTYPAGKEAYVEERWKQYTPDADAVLDALMEPTGNMLEAGWIAASDYEDRNPHEGFSIPDNDPISMFVFRAMIQAAKEGK